jgi:hypothetical protein
MVIMAFDHEGVIATDRAPVGVSVTAGYYATFLRKKLHQKIPTEPATVTGIWCAIMQDRISPSL